VTYRWCFTCNLRRGRCLCARRERLRALATHATIVAAAFCLAAAVAVALSP
jgi:hypothetical protein